MSVYQNIFNLIVNYIYGGAVTSGGYEELTAIICSTIACIFIFALPFIIVFRIIKVIC